MDQKLLYLSYADVSAVDIPMDRIVNTVEKGFEEMGHGRLEMPPKPGIHPGDGGNNFIHAMPAFVPAVKSAGVKWVSGYPGNQARGLPYISGLLILNNPDTGIPIAVMDCTWITAKRTGAASAVSARYLARPESATIGILGCGVQGHTHLEAMNVVFPLKKAMAFDPNPANAGKLAKFGNTLGLDVDIVDSPKKAVSGCDIVVTAGPILKNPHATIQAGWLDPGTFASLVDFDSYYSRDALKEADKWTTDHIGQYQYYKEAAGYFQNCPDIYAALSDLVTGKKPGRENDEEKNFAANLGLAMEDMVVAPMIYQQAVDKDIGTWLSL